MKLGLFALSVLLLGVVSAEMETVNVNNFKVSFELNKTHDYKLDTKDGFNGSLLIRTFDGPIEISLFKYPYSIDALTLLNNKKGSDIIIDGHPAKNSMLLTDQSAAFNIVEYYPDLINGKATTYALVGIGTGIDLFNAVEFLKSLHIKVGT
jgi:hypothetical protein